MNVYAVSGTHNDIGAYASEAEYMSAHELESFARGLELLIASSKPDERTTRACSAVTTDDGRECFAAVAAMSKYNAADTPLVRNGMDSPPWLIALVRSVLRGCEWGDATMRPSSPHVLPVRDGDRPADLTDEMIAEARSWEPEYRNRSRTADQRALVWREAMHDRGRGDGYSVSVRETHPRVHKALAGKSPDRCNACKENAT